MKYVIIPLWFLILSNAGISQCTKEYVQGLRKSALVIGVNKYPDEPLSNPMTDASDLARALTRLGFNTTLDTNTEFEKLEYDVDHWTSGLKNVDVAIFYFAGHGAEVDGDNFIYPALVNSSNDKVYIKRNCYPSSTLLKKMESFNPNINIIILDACRNDPTRSAFLSLTRKGLTAMPKLNPGVLVAFPVAAGQTTLDGTGQRNSIYTQAILNNIELPNLSITGIFGKIHDDVANLSHNKQTPFFNTSIGSQNDICLKFRSDASIKNPDFHIYDTSFSENLEKFRNDVPVEATKLFTRDSALFTKARQVIDLAIKDVWDSIKSICKCDLLSAFQDDNYLQHRFENSDGMSSSFYRVEVRPLIIGQVNGNEFIFSIKYHPGLTPAKREALEKSKGLSTEDVLVEPVADINWDKIRRSISRFLFLRLEMFRP
jgi:hypothetical protein